jgi:hypothetical protein
MTAEGDSVALPVPVKQVQFLYFYKPRELVRTAVEVRTTHAYT